MSKKTTILLPLAVVVLGAVVAMAMIKSRPEVQAQKPEIQPPLVRALRVERKSHDFRVETQGTVVPRTESSLVSEVSGRVLRVSDALVDGGFFEKDELLVEIDSIDYETAVTQARAQVSQAKVRLAREEEEARVAREEFGRLSEREASPLATRELQVAEAQAGLESAQANLRKADRDLERTRVRAPYDGRVREKQVDVAQFVNRGSPLARIFAVDFAEVRLPIPHTELAYLELPLGYQQQLQQQRNPESMPEVLLHTNFAGETLTWQARLVRTEGEIDRTTRMVHVVARVEDPYGQHVQRDAPLPVGLFVEAEILGRAVDGVVRLPRSAVHGKDRVWIIDDEDRIRFRDIGVLRASRNDVIVGDGLEDGDLVCLSNLDAVTDGMRVRVLEERIETELSAVPEMSP